MFDREHELYDVFGKDPRIQPLMRSTSKLAYEKSKLSVLDVQCQQPPPFREILNFVQNNNNNDIAIFETYSVDKANTEYDVLFSQQSVGLDHMVTKGVTMDHGNKNISSFFLDVYESEDSTYYQFIESLSKDSNDDAFIKNKTIFTDPFTTYKILSLREICLELNKNYPKIQTLKQFNDIVDRYSHVTEIPFLDVYLEASATVMGIETIGVGGYGQEILIEDYNSKEEAFDYYIEALDFYSEQTKHERLSLIQKIRNEILNFT
jgi:hypothetical protein